MTRGMVYAIVISWDSTGSDYITIKYNTEGVELWVARYNGTAGYDDQVHDITIDDSGNVYVTGSSTGTGTGWDFATIKYNSNGDEQWVARYKGPDSGGFATSLAISESGNVYVTGLNGGVGTGSDYATLKYNSEGIEQWAARYNGSENLSDGALSLVIDDAENVYVTGFSYIDIYDSEYITIKYIQSTPVSVNEEEIKKPVSYLLSQNYPNPFNPTTTIKYDIAKAGNVKLAVYDILGREVIILADEEKAPGFYEVNFDASHLSSGVYFYQLRANSFVVTKKMILLR